jgi:hypothetical protein
MFLARQLQHPIQSVQLRCLFAQFCFNESPVETHENPIFGQGNPNLSEPLGLGANVIKLCFQDWLIIHG